MMHNRSPVFIGKIMRRSILQKNVNEASILSPKKILPENAIHLLEISALVKTLYLRVSNLDCINYCVAKG